MQRTFVATALGLLLAVGLTRASAQEPSSPESSAENTVEIDGLRVTIRPPCDHGPGIRFELRLERCDAAWDRPIRIERVSAFRDGRRLRGATLTPGRLAVTRSASFRARGAFASSIPEGIARLSRGWPSDLPDALELRGNLELRSDQRLSDMLEIRLRVGARRRTIRVPTVPCMLGLSR